jgi:hypothetical protein
MSKMNVEQERALKQYVEEAFQPLAHIINSMGRDLRQMTQTMLQPLLNTTIIPSSHHSSHGASNINPIGSSVETSRRHQNISRREPFLSGNGPLLLDTEK